jgi:hypothetical protein
MKLLIITSDPKVLRWKTLDSKLDTIHDALPSFERVTIQHTAFTPKVINGRIDHAWSDEFKKPFFNQGFDIIGLHFTDADRTKFGLKPSLRGSNPNTKQEWGDFWFWANENTKRNGLNQFVQTCLHELAHEYHQQTKTPDGVHAYHDANPDIIPYVKALDWSKYQPRRMQLKTVRNLLQRIVGLLKAQQRVVAPLKLQHPVEVYKSKISQPYGVVNPIYPQTGHHIGTDYATPVGTPVVAPWDGEVTQSGFTATAGFFCHYKYTYQGQTYIARYLHLVAAPKRTTYKRGEVIELSGNTGKSTGPHLHVDVWRDKIELEKLTAKSFRNYTINPEEHYV